MPCLGSPAVRQGLGIRPDHDVDAYTSEVAADELGLAGRFGDVRHE